MKYILVIDDNFYNQTGIHSLLNGKISGVRLLNSINYESYKKASLIIISFSLLNDLPFFLCLNKQHAVKIICMFDKSEHLDKKVLPTCMSNIMLVPNNIGLLQFYHLVLGCVDDNNEIITHSHICDLCTRDYFSPQQFNILSRLFKGQTVHDISNDLMISKSTIYSHKRYVMTKYNLKTRHDLYLFWKFINSGRTCDNLNNSN